MASNKQALQEWNRLGRPSECLSWDIRKTTKQRLRKALRQANADKRNKLYHDVISANSHDTRLFHQLIQKQKNSKTLSGDRLMVNGELITSHSAVTQAWTEHFTALAAPQAQPDPDEDYDDLVSDDLLVMDWAVVDHPDPYTPLDAIEVMSAVRLLKNNKAADIYGLKAEHFKHAGPQTLSILTDTLDIALRGNLPTQLKDSYILPIHKKGKDPLDRDCYRGITITPTLSKILEHIVLNQVVDGLTQNPLQFGFTKNSSPSLAILAVTEAILDAHDTKSPLYVVTIDIRKAFDVVRQDSLGRKLYNQVDSHSWRFLKENLHTLAHVRSNGMLGDPFEVTQGVGQGNIFSTHCYKAYINDLLDRLAQACYGHTIGGVYIGAPTCADDIVLLSDSPLDMQTQIDVVATYARQ